MAKKVYSYIVMIIFFIVLLFLTYINYDNNKKIKLLSGEINFLTQRNQLLKTTLFNYCIISGTINIPNKIFISNEEFVSLSDIIKSKTVIARISQSSCNPCLKRELKYIKELEDNNIPIIIFASFSNKRSLNALLADYNITSTVYLLERNNHLFHFDDFIRLYTFTIDNNLNVGNLFIPVQYEDELSKEYHKYLKTLFDFNN